MKKTIFMLAAVLVAFAANAQCYLIGEPAGGWSYDKGTQMTASGSTYSVEYTCSSAGTKYFGFATKLASNWDELNANRYYPVGSQDVTVDTEMSFSSSRTGEESWKITMEAGTTYKFEVNTSTSKFKVTKAGEVVIKEFEGGDVYFEMPSSWSGTPNLHYWGGASETTWPGNAMTLVSGNIYKGTVPAKTTGIIFNASGKQTANIEGEEIVAGHLYQSSGSHAEYTGSTDPEDPTDPTDPEDPIENVDLYLVGAFNNWTPGDANYIFTRDGNNYTITVAALDGAFKISRSTWDDGSFGGDTGGQDVDAVDAVIGNNTLWYGSSVNLTANNWTNVTLSFTWDGTSTSGTSITLNVAAAGSTDPEEPIVVMPENLYLVGHVNGTAWATTEDKVVAGTKSDNSFTWSGVKIDDSGNGKGYFSFITTPGSDWNAVNSGDRYGAESDDETVSLGATHNIAKYAVNVSASAAKSWAIPAGTYGLEANFKNMTLVASDNTGVEYILVDGSDAVYYNLQGVRVDNPSNGIYIRRQGNTVKKVVVK